MTARKRHPLCALILLSVFGTLTYANQASDLTDFGTCLSSASGSLWNAATATCTLPYYSSPYMIASPLTISSTAIRYITGGSGGQPTLERDITGVSYGGDYFPIMKAASSAVKNLVIENLIFNGNRAGTNTWGQPIACLTSYLNGWIDLDLTASGNSGTANSGVNVYNVEFDDAPSIALWLGSWSYVYSSSFYRPRTVGAYANSNSIVDYNHFYDGGVEAVAPYSNVLVEYNLVQGNHREFSYGSAGSELAVYGNGITFLSNYVDGNGINCVSGCTGAPPASCSVSGNSTYTPNGLELYQPGTTVINDEFYNHSGAGLLIFSVDGSSLSPANSVTLSSSDPSWVPYNIEYNSASGVLMQYASPPGNFGGPFSFTNLRSENNGRYGFEWSSTAGEINAGTTLSWGSGSAACLTGNGPYPYTNYYTLPSGFSGPTYTNSGC